MPRGDDAAAGIDLRDLDPMLTGFGGGVCVRIEGVVVGGVAVSGLSADEDEAWARVGAATVEPPGGSGALDTLSAKHLTS